jgi:ABC-type branched-subunit amino acid transport system substrate-binding protein
MSSARLHRKAVAMAAMAVVVVSSGLAGCAKSGTSGAAPPAHSTLIIGLFDPFSGPDAIFGQEMVPPCEAAVKVINTAGGVLGHKLACKAVDTRGDPADAVPAARQMIATTPNLVGVIGPSSDEMDATAPIINAAHIPFVTVSGEPSFNHTHLQYYWRNTPSDDATGYALAARAIALHYMRGAAVFGNDINAQANVPGLLASFPKAGRKLVINLQLAPTQSSYQTEVSRVIATHPDVVFSEADSQTSATFFGEYKQLNGGKLPPILVTNVGMQPDWYRSVSSVIGKPMMTDISGVQTYASFSGAAYQAYKSALLSLTNVKDPQQYFTNTYVMSYFDNVTMFAIAMLAAKSVNPVVWNSYIPRITQTAGGAPVHTFAEAAAKLPGTKVDYVGAIGEQSFNQWHNSSGGFEVAQWLPNGQLKQTAIITSAQISALQSGG